MVELKNGESISGILTNCDGFMNLVMQDVVLTSKVVTFKFKSLEWSKILENR